MLQNFANLSIQFEASECIRNEGRIICRECGREAQLTINFISLFVLTISRVRFQGAWCFHSNIKVAIEEIIANSAKSVENNRYF